MLLVSPFIRILAVVVAFLSVVVPAARAVEIELANASRDGFKSSIKSIGQGIQRGKIVSLLETPLLRRELITFKQQFVSRLSRKPVALKCRYAPAPMKQRRLELKHAVEVRLEIPLDIQLRNAAVSVAVDRGANATESASVIFSLSF
jgi:hypothetical protein